MNRNHITNSNNLDDFFAFIEEQRQILLSTMDLSQDSDYEFSPEMYFDTNTQTNDKTITTRQSVLLPENDQSDQKEKSIEEIISEFD
jgi:hypothetical protein